MKTIYATFRIDVENNPNGLTSENIAELVASNANAHNHTIEDGVKIDNVEFCGLNETDEDEDKKEYIDPCEFDYMREGFGFVETLDITELGDVKGVKIYEFDGEYVGFDETPLSVIENMTEEEFENFMVNF